MTEKKPRTPNIHRQAGNLANEIVTALGRISRHEASAKEARNELATLEKNSDPQVLAMAKALLSATLTTNAVTPDPTVKGGDGGKGAAKS